jgi:hypothetical protein
MMSGRHLSGSIAIPFARHEDRTICVRAHDLDFKRHQVAADSSIVFRDSV